jgi:phytoene/squalene synthetase
MTRAESENFPVASRLLDRRVREHLLAVYGFARLVDELGDSFAGDRLGALDWLEQDLDRAFDGRAQHPLLKRLQPTLTECALSRGPFVRLIEANRMDQRVSRYEICTALQLAEHCQDVAEDRDRGRVYLPVQDLVRCGCTIADLSREHAGESLCAVLALQVRRARELLAQGALLIDDLDGVRVRLAVAAFVAGGRAALDAIERAGYDVLAGPPRAGAARRLLALAGTLAERR